jgi:hypothetical protein
MRATVSDNIAKHRQIVHAGGRFISKIAAGAHALRDRVYSAGVLKMLQLQWTASSILKEEVIVFVR